MFLFILLEFSSLYASVSMWSMNKAYDTLKIYATKRANMSKCEDMPQNTQICHTMRKYVTNCAKLNQSSQSRQYVCSVSAMSCLHSKIDMSYVVSSQYVDTVSCRVSMSPLCRVESVCRHCVATSVSITGVWKNRHRYIKYLDVSDWITEAAVTWLVISTDCVTNCSYVYVCVRAIHSASRVGQMILFFKNGGFWGHSAH